MLWLLGQGMRCLEHKSLCFLRGGSAMLLMKRQYFLNLFLAKSSAIGNEWPLAFGRRGNQISLPSEKNFGFPASRVSTVSGVLSPDHDNFSQSTGSGPPPSVASH